MRLSRRIEGYNTQQFPTLGTTSSTRFTVAWNATNSGIAGPVLAGTLGQYGPITSPAAFVPGNGQVPLNYNLCGYYSVVLGDLHAFAGDSYEQFKEYRIRKVTYTFTNRMPTYTGNPGGGNFSAGPEGAEVMIVNTSKTGQFVMPRSMSENVLGNETHEDYPWYQVLNYPNCRNISKVYRLKSGRATTIRMTVDATEDYIASQVQDVSSTEPVSSLVFTGDSYMGMTPQNAAIGTYTANSGSLQWSKTLAARHQMKRRRFRWTRQWLLWVSSSVETPSMLYVRNDLKRAHGIQFMVKAGTYWQSTLPYFNVSITMQVEFRGRLLQQLPSTIPPTADVLFPYTNATFNTVG